LLLSIDRPAAGGGDLWVGDGGRAGALRVWEKERNEMTTGEGRAFPWFTSTAAGTA